ncbi:MAG: hypothetical protein IT430_03915 [Phycisphaerales bacterium]|nr:hypothetical protein [Phycisphaerales bacterium]
MAKAQQPDPRQQMQDFVDSLISEASEELKQAPADAARILQEIADIASDLANRGGKLDSKTTAWLKRSIETAIATGVVRNTGRAARSQRAALQLAAGLLIGAISGVDLRHLSR